MFCLNHASAFYKSNNTSKMLINNKSKAQTLTRNPTWNNRCQLLVSRVLNMPCRFSHSARSIESRCVVRVINLVIALEMGLVGERVVSQVSVNVWWHNGLAECWLDIQELYKATPQGLQTDYVMHIHKNIEASLQICHPRERLAERHPAQKKSVWFPPNSSLNNVLTQAGIGRLLLGHRLRRTLKLVPDSDMLMELVHRATFRAFLNVFCTHEVI